jgi:hypothetical protein
VRGSRWCPCVTTLLVSLVWHLNPPSRPFEAQGKRGRLQVATVKANLGSSILTSNFRCSAITAGAFAEHPGAIAIFAGDVVAEAAQPAAEALGKLVPCAP